MPQVIIEQPGLPPMTVPLSEGETTFGRSEDCDVVLIAEEVSRNHARISLRNGRTLLTDLKSLNGTYVNRQRIVERVLSHMDEVWFGSRCRMVYRDDTHFGTQKSELSTPQDSQVHEKMRRIREEMEQLGNSMTMIGKRTPTLAGVASPSPVSPGGASPEEIIRMGRAYRRLAALHRVSSIMASKFDLRKRLSQVLDMAMETMDADRGFVMLREAGTNNLTVKVAREMGRDLEASSPSMGIAGRAAIDGEPVLMNKGMQDNELAMRESIIQHRIVSAMCVPLRVEDRILGSIYVDSRKANASFTEEDLELFASLASQSAMAIDNVRLHEQVVESEKKKQDLSRFLSPDVVDKIMRDGATLSHGGEKTLATTLFCDIRGFTTISERLTPQEVVSLLNEHFTAMTEIIFQFQGSINKFMGDAVMAVFGAPIAIGNDASNAVRAAFAMMKKNEELNQLRAQEHRPQFQIGIGIDTGQVSAGYVGSPMRLEYTVIGDRVNTASRFCGMAKPGQIIIGHDTWLSARENIEVRAIGTVVLKGKGEPVQAYEVLGILSNSE
jgi:adenylate cyclase